MGSLCESADFWNQTFARGSNVTFAQFTTCVYNSVFWVASAILWVCAPIYAWYLCRWRDTAKSLPISWIYNLKFALSVAQLAICTAELITRAAIVDVGGGSYIQPYIMGPIMEAATLLLLLMLMELERRRGLITSGVLFIYWCLTNLTNVIALYTMWAEADSDPTTSEFDLYSAYYVLSFTQLIVCCVVEKLPAVEGKQPCQETRCSFLSRMTYSWIRGIMKVGYQRPLTEDDLFYMNDGDQSKTVVPRFENNWREEQDRLSRDSAKSTSPKESNKHEKVTVMEKPSLPKVMARTFGTQFVIGQCTGLLHVTMELVYPVLLGYLIDASDDLSSARWKGYLLCVAFFGAILVQSIMWNILLKTNFSVSTRISAALNSAIFKKSLTMDNESRTKSTVGEIVNLISVDLDHVTNFCTWDCWELWAAPVRILTTLVLLYFTVGWAVLAGLLVLVVMVPLNYFLARKMHALENEHKEHKDKRMKLITEVLNGIKILKLYAWDMTFAEKVTQIRDKELRYIMKTQLYDAAASFSWSIVPFFIGLSTLATYIYISEDHVMGPQTAFVALALFQRLAGTLNYIPYLVMDTVKSRVCLRRLEEFLHHDDIDTHNVTRTQSDAAVSIHNGTFAWNPEIGPCLKNINLTIPRGNLVAVVGQVGAGKSSLMSVVLGDMLKISGNVNVSGRIAYVSQQAWIQNATFKDNILFGHPMNAQKYRNIIESCALTTDLQVFPAKDMTEIGEKGINLSGGQKQRVSLARAVYFNSDIYLMDDPLSAVDSHVGKHIFEHVIGNEGLLRNKTRILVTHGIKWLPFMDNIVVINDGIISERGTYEELLDHDGPFAKFLTTYITNKEDSESSDSDEEVKQLKAETIQRLHSLHSQDSKEEYIDGDSVSETAIIEITDSPPITDSEIHKSEMDHDSPKVVKRTHRRKSPPNEKTLPNKVSGEEDGQVVHGPNEPYKMVRSISGHEHEETVENWNDNDGKIIEDEELETGQIRWVVIKAFISALGRNIVVLVLMFCVLRHLIELWSSAWLAAWTSDKQLQNLTLVEADSQVRYELNLHYIKIYTVLGVCQSVMQLFKTLLSTKAHINASEILHKRMLVSILRSPMSFFDTTPVGRIVNRFAGDIATIDHKLPWQVTFFLLCMMTFAMSLCVIVYTAPEIVVVLTPVAILYYIVQREVLPAKRQIRRLETKTRSPIYSNLSESLNGVCVIRAFGVQERFAKETHERVDRNHECGFTNMILDRWFILRLDVLGGLVVSLAAAFAMYNRENIGGALVGLLMSWGLDMQDKIAWFLDLVAHLQHSFVNVERIEQYINVPSEAALKTEHVPPAFWPTEGDVELKSYSVRYRDGLDLVLKNVNVSIKSGEKVGIVGRTGAGKSSLTLSLFRLLEPASGSIIIDGLDVCKLGLHDLRSRLTILPQDPVLFSGSLRMNLDPLDEHTDVAIFTALEHAHLMSFVESLPGGLKYEVGEGGQNLSVGQRQLLCLARSLLRKSNVLVLDEATAAVDMETDDLIQKTIRTEFTDSTVLAIAHRLNTVIDYDRILVLEHGEVKEFDTPKALLQNQKSIFYELAKDAGLV